MEKYRIEIKWALIFGAIYLIWMIIEKQLGFHSEKALQEPLFNLIFIPISFILFFLALREKKKVVFNNEIEWKQGFASGIVLSFLITIISTTVVYITFSLISPNFFETAINMSKNKEVAQFNFNLPVFVKNNIFDKLSFSVVFAATISYMIKTK